MKKLLKKMHILLGMCLFAMSFMACRNNAQNQDNEQGKAGDIIIKSVTLGTVDCTEGKPAVVAKAQEELKVEFQEAYENLAVKVNNTSATVSGKFATYPLKDITEAGLAVKIDVTANNRNPKSYSFIAKLGGGEVVIDSVRLDGKKYFEGQTAETENDAPELSITFKEEYQGLVVKVNGDKVDVVNKVATKRLANITEAGVDVRIEATLEGRTPKTFNFKVVLKLGTISGSVKFADKPVAENATIDTNDSQGDVSITFDETYQELNVKINNDPVTPAGNVATKTISDIKEDGTEVKIDATAKGKKPFSYKFTVKKLKPTEIGIESVTFDNNIECTEGKTIETEKTEGDVKVTFVEAYAGLTVTINETPVTPAGKVATFKLSNIGETDVTINATATSKIPKEYKFKLKKVLPLAEIKELKIEAEGINSQASIDKNIKTYSKTTAPLLSEIADNGSTKVGDAREPKAVIKIGYEGTPEGQKLKVENTTTGTSEETTSTNWGSMEAPAVGLKKGDNNLVITYSEKGKRDLVYKLIVGYVEPEYEPIKLIAIGGKTYDTKDKLANLINGTETSDVYGDAKIKVEVEIPELWYNEEGWTLKLDNVSYPKSDFVRVGYNTVIYRLIKEVSLTEDDTKVVKIEFENTARTYKKEYKSNVTHHILYKLKKLVFINPADNKEISKREYVGYKLNDTKEYYVASYEFSAEDRMGKATFVIEAEDEAVGVEYAISETKVTLDQISSWTPLAKESVTYKDYYSEDQTVEAYAIKEKEINHGSSFLYLALKKGTKATYYVQEINREKIPNNDAGQNGVTKLVYQDAGGEKIEDHSPISEKGLIRVLPNSPRATVKLTVPEAKDFVLASDGWYECQITLAGQTTSFEYRIVAEDGITDKLYDASPAFTKDSAISGVKFAYKEDEDSWKRIDTSEIDGKVYINIDKKEVKDKKIYLFVDAFKDVAINHADFVQKSVTTGYASTTHVFEVDVTSIVDAPNTPKDLTVPLTINTKPCGELKLAILLKDEIINDIGVRRKATFLLPDGKYICKSEGLDYAYYDELTIKLYFISDAEKQKPAETNRLIKVFNGSKEISMTVNEYETQSLEFKNQGFKVEKNEKITLKIQYFADKNNTSSPTKEYTLEIEDI